MKRSGQTGMLILALAASLLCLLAGALTRELVTEQAKYAIGAVYEADPEAAGLMAEALLSGRRGDGAEAAQALGLTGRFFAFLDQRIFGWGWLAVMLLLALLPPVLLLLVRRTERTRQASLARRVESALAGERVFLPENREEVLLAKALAAYADLREKTAQREDEQRRRVENIAHELKTPASGILLTLDLAEKNGMTQERFSRMRDAAENMQRYIGELLTLARLRAGKVRIVRKEVDLAALLAELAEEMPGVSVTGNREAVLLGDRERLWEAFRNLAANALRHGEDGTCRIRLFRRDDELRVEVRNRGGSLPQLERYAAGHEDGTSSGLGTAIAGEIVRAHFGTLAASSDRGDTVMTAIFPLDRLKKKETV